MLNIRRPGILRLITKPHLLAMVWLVGIAGACGVCSATGATAVVLRADVQLPDATPVTGAVVVTSLGGHAVTDSHGAFAIRVDVPEDEASFAVTAIATIDGVTWVGTRQVNSSQANAREPCHLGSIVLSPGGQCQPQWIPTFGGSDGTNNAINDLVVFDDGSGPAVYAGGKFTTAGNVLANHIARWDGEQ